jgi:hypothetical protein
LIVLIVLSVGGCPLSTKSIVKDDPKNATLRSDLGFNGYAPTVREHLQPKKAEAR